MPARGVLAIVALLSWPVSAATLTWTGASSVNWNDAGNWNPSQLPATGDDLVFTAAGLAPRINDLPGTVQLHSVTFDDNGNSYTILGNAIVLQSGGSITENNSATAPLIIFLVPIALNGPATFTAAAGDNGLDFVDEIGGTGGLTLINNTAAVDGLVLSSANTYSGPTAIGGIGPVRADRNGSIPTGSAVTVDPGGTLWFSRGSTIGSLAGSGTVTTTVGSLTLEVGGDNTSTTFSGVLADRGIGVVSLSKVGSGTLTLSGANTYTGATTVAAGTLAVDGSTAAGGTITAASGATLCGTGTVNGDVVLQDGSSICAGPTVVGTLTPASSATVVSPSPATVAIGTPQTFTATITSGGVPVTAGAVTFVDATTSATLASNVALDGSGQAAVTVTLAAGSHAIQATYSPDRGHSGSFDTTGATVITVPGAPTIGTATPGKGQATVSFSPPASNGGSAITSYAATCGTQSAAGAASPITVSGLANGVTVSCSVTATNIAGTGPASGTVSVTPSFNVFSGPSATGSGTITASFTGGGPGCSFVNPQFIAAPPGAAPVPPTIPAAGIVFAHGLFDFSTTGCTAGSTLTFTIVYPSSIAGERYWKYGPTSTNAAPHWYVLPATISGNTATFSITDGGLGDDDLDALNGAIVDQGGPGGGGGGSALPVPTLSEWMLALLALGVLALGLQRARGHGRMTK